MNPDCTTFNSQVEYYPRAQIVHQPLFLDGFTRTGKFLLGSLLDSLEKIEYFQNPLLLETSLYLAKLRKLDFQTLKILIQTEIDFNSYNMAIGRNLNSRKSDESSILKSVKTREYLSRSEFEDQNILFERFLCSDSLPLYITHEALCSLGMLFEIYPKLRFISMQRNPIALIKSWFDRGWGHRWGSDPKSFSIAFDKKGKPVPWFAIEWADQYWNLNEIERIVKSIHCLSKMAKEEYEELNSDKSMRVIFVEFDKLISSPQSEVERLGLFLGRMPLSGLKMTMTRQNLPREIDSKKLEQTQEYIQSKLSKLIKDLFHELVDEYKNYWSPLTELNNQQTGYI